MLANYKFGYVVINKKGEIYFYEEEPTLTENQSGWQSTSGSFMSLNSIVGAVEAINGEVVLGHIQKKLGGYDWKNSLHAVNIDWSIFPLSVYVPSLNIDDKILVRANENSPWYKRRFHSFEDDGSVNVFVDGGDSWTSGFFKNYTFWELP